MKKSRRKTDGGPKGCEVSPISVKVASIVPAQLASLSNPYDDDAATSEEEAERPVVNGTVKNM